jgi:hypothetical protein
MQVKLNLEADGNLLIKKNKLELKGVGCGQNDQ